MHEDGCLRIEYVDACYMKLYRYPVTADDRSEVS